MNLCCCCYGSASPGNGSSNLCYSRRYSSSFFARIDDFFLLLPPSSSRVHPGFKLKYGNSYSVISMTNPNNRPGISLPLLLKTLESQPVEDFTNEMIDSLVTDLTPKEQTVLLKKQRGWMRALHLFRRMKSAMDYPPNPIHYNVILRTLGKAGRWDELRLCWVEMAKDGVFPTNSTYATLMDIYGKAGLVKEALLWLKHMKSRGLFPDEVSMNTAMQILKDARHFDLGERFFRDWCAGKLELEWLDFISDGFVDSAVISPKHFLLTELFKSGGRGPVSQIASSQDKGPQKPKRAATYNTLIDLYGKAGRLEDASEAFSEMLRSGVIPDTLTFNTMINICCCNGRLLEAESLLSKMEERGVQPDTKTFNIFMTYHASNGDANNVLRSHRKIREYRLHPDVVSYRIILQTLCKMKMVSEVEAVLVEIMESGCRVDEQSIPVVTKMYISEGLLDKAFIFLEKHCSSGDISSKNCAAIIDLYAEKGFWKEAEDVFMRKRNLGCKMDVLEHNVMIKAYGKCRLYDKGLELFEMMRCTGPSPDECTYNSVIQMVAGGDSPGKAKEILSQMRRSGFIPRCESYSAIIASYGRDGELSDAEEIFREMKAMGVEPNEIVYGSLIDAFAESGRINEAVEYYRMMEKSGVTTNHIVLTSMIKAYSKVSRWKEAEVLYAMMKNSLEGPDVIASNCMINLFADLGMVHEAKSIFDDLRRSGNADGVSYATMMYLYKSIGMLEEATYLAQEIQQSGLLTNCSSYNSVMASYADYGKLKDCGELLYQMLSRKMLPDDSIFKTIFNVLKKGGLPSEAISQLESSYTEGKSHARQAVIASLFSVVGLHGFALKSCESFLSSDVELESFAYNAAIGAYGAAGEVDKALNLYLRMQDEGLGPDIVTYVNLASCYGKARMIEGLKRIYSLLKYEEIEPSESLYRALIHAYKEAGRGDLAQLVDQDMRFNAQYDIQVKDE
ncbi:Pentatricopeptide repeat-containing protein [Apostasia shenzhenica]|uniref:Pentatricopeptide repeat-containing protein n=1 Tax=Apostasia shenzhenica TaxID=1088818 RepID=A0A2I0B7G2_9ASPA|nr:Pentatricopeptide repeat-containing protein [Apostasia shenzhenica]